MAQVNTNMILFLLCIILQTGVLVVLFKDKNVSAILPTSESSPHDVQQLQHAINQLSHNLNNSIYANQQQNTKDLQSALQSLSDLHATSKEIQDIHILINNILSQNKTGTGAALPTQASFHIKDTYPELMKYRYALADAQTNPGAVRTTTMKPNVVLLEENGLRYWGWNGDMVNWVYDESGGSGEWLVREVFRKVLTRSKDQSPPNLVLDVGSNTGLFSMIAAVYNTKRVYAFDPQILCAQYVAESAKVNGFDSRIAIINAFVGADETHKAQVPTDTCSGIFKVSSKRATMEIHSVNLDKYFLTDPDVIDLVKIDVEGAEIIVLEGAKELFKQHRVRSLAIEITTGWWDQFGVTYDRGAALIKEMLVDTNYKMWVMPMDKNPPTKLNNYAELDKAMRPPPNYHNQKNYLFSLDDVY